MQNEGQKEKRAWKFKEKKTYTGNGKQNFTLLESQKQRKERMHKAIFEKNMAENFPNVKIDIMPEMQDICKHQENTYKENPPRDIRYKR